MLKWCFFLDLSILSYKSNFAIFISWRWWIVCACFSFGCYISWLRRSYPAISLSILPFSLSFCLVFHAEINSTSMLQIIFPLSDISVSILKNFCTFSFYFTVFEFSFIFWLIWPSHYSFAFHVIISKFTFINFSCLWKIIFSYSMKLSINKITFIKSANKFKFAFSCFFTLQKLSGKFDFVIIPWLNTFSMLLVIFPLSNIHGSIGVNKNSMTISFSI